MSPPPDPEGANQQPDVHHHPPNIQIPTADNGNQPPLDNESQGGMSTSMSTSSLPSSMIISSQTSKKIKHNSSFVVESGIHTLLASIPGILLNVFVVRSMVSRRAGQFWGEDAIFDPPIVGSIDSRSEIAMVSIFPGYRDEGYCDSQAQSYDLLTNPYYHLMISGSFPYITLYPAVYGAGRYNCILVIYICYSAFSVIYGGGLYTDYEHIWANDGNMDDEYSLQLHNQFKMILLFGPPVVSMVCIALSNRTRKVRLFFLIVGYVIFTIFVGRGQYYLQEYFFRSAGSLLEKMAVKCFGQFIINTVFVELSWQTQKHLTLHHGVGNVGPVLLSHALPSMTISARFMSGTAETFTEVIAFEVAATIA